MFISTDRLDILHGDVVVVVVVVVVAVIAVTANCCHCQLLPSINPIPPLT